MNKYIEDFKVWWAARQQQERQFLLVGAVAVAVAIFYLAIWEPVARAQRKADAALRQSRTVANRLETIAVEVERARGQGGGNNRALPLMTAVDQATHRPELGKEPSRVQEGDKEVKVWFDDVPFDALVAWLALVQTQYGIVASSAELERKAEGVVTARLSLVRP